MQSDVLPKGLPISDELRATAISLEHLGVREVAWSRARALDVISTLRGPTWAVLGGDVLVQCDGVFRHSYDSWHSDPVAEEACPEFVQRSHRESRTYIERFPEKPDSPTAYVLVFAPCEGRLLDLT
jgi:Immunity protein 40